MNTIPQFLNEFLKSQYEENIAKNIIKGYSKNRPVTLRANTLKTNIDYIKNIFTKLNISYINVPWYSDALILKNISEEQLKNLDIYKNGFIYLQSLSSMIPPIILFFSQAVMNDLLFESASISVVFPRGISATNP